MSILGLGKDEKDAAEGKNKDKPVPQANEKEQANKAVAEEKRTAAEAEARSAELSVIKVKGSDITFDGTKVGEVNKHGATYQAHVCVTNLLRDRAYIVAVAHRTVTKDELAAYLPAQLLKVHANSPLTNWEQGVAKAKKAEKVA